MYLGLTHLIGLRKQYPGFAGVTTPIIDPGNDAVFGYVRPVADARVLALANMTDDEQTVAANQLRIHGLAYRCTDLISGDPVENERDLLLDPYRFVWLEAAE